MAEENEELQAAAELDESTVLDPLRARFDGAGHEDDEGVEGVIKDGLAAKKYINVTYKGCGRWSRHSIADLSTRPATVKLIATELTPPPLRLARPTARPRGPQDAGARTAHRPCHSCPGRGGSATRVSHFTTV